MGNAGHSLYEMQHRAMHDGALRCALCADASPDADHDWCPAAEAIICEECCGAAVSGEPHPLMTVTVPPGEMVRPDALFQACVNCERGRNTFARHMLAEVEVDGEYC